MRILLHPKVLSESTFEAKILAELDEILNIMKG